MRVLLIFFTTAVVARTRLNVMFIHTLPVLFLAAMFRVNIPAFDSRETFLSGLPMLFLLFSSPTAYVLFSFSN